MENNELNKKIIEIVKVSDYKLKSMQIDNLHFGNIIVILESRNELIRFVQDRGDIYKERKSLTSEYWGDQVLEYSHAVKMDNSFSLLILAIENFINKKQNT